MWYGAVGFLVTLTLSLLAAPLVATAQPRGKIPRVGVLEPTPQQHPAPCLPAFRQGLRDLGYVEGQTILLDYRYAEGRPDRLPALDALEPRSTGCQAGDHDHPHCGRGGPRSGRTAPCGEPGTARWQSHGTGNTPHRARGKAPRAVQGRSALDCPRGRPGRPGLESPRRHSQHHRAGSPGAARAAPARGGDFRRWVSESLNLTKGCLLKYSERKKNPSKEMQAARSAPRSGICEARVSMLIRSSYLCWFHRCGENCHPAEGSQVTAQEKLEEEWRSVSTALATSCRYKSSLLMIPTYCPRMD